METTEVVSAESSTHAISHPTKRPREGDEEKEDAQNEAKKIKVTVDEKVEVKPDNRVCYVFTKAALVAFDLLPVNKGRVCHKRHTLRMCCNTSARHGWFILLSRATAYCPNCVPSPLCLLQSLN